jgi:glycosyltransferase involved in cell wall biosynthesis
VIPAYNEETGIEGVIDRLSALDLGTEVEILVVNDGSDDGTSAKLEMLEQRYPKLRTIEHPWNKGYGAALKTGFAAARTEVVVITDADGTYPEDRIRDLLNCIDSGAEMAVGSRTGADVNIPLIRRPAKACLRWLASFLAGTRIPDLNSGLRAFRRDFVLRYRPILPSGFSFTTTISLAGLTNDHHVEYVKINYAPRHGSSKIRPIRDTLGFTLLILRTILYFNPLKVLLPAGTLLGLGFLASVYNDAFLSDPPNLGDKTVMLLVATVQILSLGAVADLIEKRTKL